MGQLGIFSSIFIGILIFGLVVTSAYSVTRTTFDGYGLVVDESQASSFDKTQNISIEINDNLYEIKNNFKISLTSFLGLIPNALELIKNIVTLPINLITELINSAAGIFGISESVTFLITILIVVLVFAILSTIMRWFL